MWTWVESKGPLVAVPETRLEAWSGSDLEDSPDPSDYDRACDVSDEVGVIQCGGEDVLVLGDEPDSTTWVPLADGGLLVRWVYADSEASVVAALERGLPELEDTQVTVSVNGSYRLLAAVEAGADAEHSIRMTLEQGRYRVQTATLDAGPEVRLLIHRLVRE